MTLRRTFDGLHFLVAITFPLWTVFLWIDIHVRLLVGLIMILDPTSHQIKTAMMHVVLYGVLYTFLVCYEPPGEPDTRGVYVPSRASLRGVR
jgi:hypothetical protein